MRSLEDQQGRRLQLSSDHHLATAFAQLKGGVACYLWPPTT